jgi:hypothetical protein
MFQCHVQSLEMNFCLGAPSSFDCDFPQIIIYLNVNKVSKIHFENMLKIYFKYTRDMPLFHSILRLSFCLYRMILLKSKFVNYNIGIWSLHCQLYNLI